MQCNQFINYWTISYFTKVVFYLPYGIMLILHEMRKRNPVPFPVSNIPNWNLWLSLNTMGALRLICDFENHIETDLSIKHFFRFFQWKSQDTKDHRLTQKSVATNPVRFLWHRICQGLDCLKFMCFLLWSHGQLQVCSLQYKCMIKEL